MFFMVPYKSQSTKKIDAQRAKKLKNRPKNSGSEIFIKPWGGGTTLSILGVSESSGESPLSLTFYSQTTTNQCLQFYLSNIRERL